VEVLIAPGFTPEALDYCKRQQAKAGLRLLDVGPLGDPVFDDRMEDIRGIAGGILFQERDLATFFQGTSSPLLGEAASVVDRLGKQRVVGTVTHKKPRGDWESFFSFANKACKHVKSNAICIAREYEPGCYHMLGMGAGQPNRSLRVFQAASAQMSESQYVAHQLAAHCVAASDAFFPFQDGVEDMAAMGIKTVIQPGGSINDGAVIARANELGLAMVFTGMRHFRH
jgi:phosphoribosylaminoimidazolecarboxamide formyltransferase/IMP cyclohydrolase